MGDDEGEGEVLHTPADRTLGMLPREKMARTRGITEPRRPSLWAQGEVFEGAPAPVFGAYPKGFVLWACRAIGCAPAEVLHMCSGMLTAADGGVRVDVRQAARPTLRADARALPIAEGAVRGVLIDPPYSVEYAADLYGTDYPRPSHLLAEAARVVRPGGRIGLLHFFIPFPPPGTRIVCVRGVTQGCGYRIRAFTIYAREGQGELFP
jgi:SAM-dependent methyltransferase